jgi:hypothetical protein
MATTILPASLRSRQKLRRLSMKTLVCIVALVWSCPVLLAQSSDSSSCAKPNPGFGYASDLKLPKSARAIKIYNVDYPETHKHDPICLSKRALDSIFWVSASGKKFKLKIYLAPDQDQSCGKHPFVTDPASDDMYGLYSGPLKADVPNNCVYEVEFQVEGGQVMDPHIKTGP